jgi:hypothetical protein
MSHDLNNRGPADAKRMNIPEFRELEPWSKRFSATKELVEETLARAEVMAPDVRRQLAK